MRGLERADLVTWDAHQRLSVPTAAGTFCTHHPDAPPRVCSTETSDALREGPGETDARRSTAAWISTVRLASGPEV